MKFEIPFNEDITRKQTKLKFDLIWDKILKKQKTNLIVSIFSILFSSLIIYGNGNVGYIILIMGLFVLFGCYRVNLLYQENKKNMRIL